jgi:hypothetical protein
MALRRINTPSTPIENSTADNATINVTVSIV